jgi:hypothetical protein
MNWLARILDALLRSKPPERPRVVENELAKDYGDVAAWRARAGGIAPPDAPHIEDDGTI